MANFSECIYWTVYISNCYYQKLVVLTFNCDLTLIICNPYSFLGLKKKKEQKWTWYLYDYIVLDLSRSKYSPWNDLYQLLLLKLIKRIIIILFFFFFIYFFNLRKRNPLLCSMVTIVIDYGQQIEWVARYIGQSFFIILFHANRLLVSYSISLWKIKFQTKKCKKRKKQKKKNRIWL